MRFLGKEGKEVSSEEKKQGVKGPGVEESREPGRRGGRRPAMAGRGPTLAKPTASGTVVFINSGEELDVFYIRNIDSYFKKGTLAAEWMVTDSTVTRIGAGRLHRS